MSLQSLPGGPSCSSMAQGDPHARVGGAGGYWLTVFLGLNTLFSDCT